VGANDQTTSIILRANFIDQSPYHSNWRVQKAGERHPVCALIAGAFEARIM
jgi:hypothetical protein